MKSATRNSAIAYPGYAYVAIGFNNAVAAVSAHLEFDFTRYDFSASAGMGIESATATANGYDGDPITFSASLQSGYDFDGWYNGGTKVSSSLTYNYTVNGTDLSLEARAVPATKTVTVTYDGMQIMSQSFIPPMTVSYNGTQIASIGSGQTKILQCDGKIMIDDVVITGGIAN